jgi:hypothetical protein
MGDVDVSYGEILIIDTYDTNAANIELANIAQSVSAYATGSPGSVLYSPLIGISAETFYFSNNVFITNDLTISGSIFFSSLVVSGDSVFQSNLNIVKDCSINSNLYVDKVTTLEEQVNINGPLSTGGAVYFQGAHTHTIEDSIEVGNVPGAAPGVAIGPTPRADSQIQIDSSYGNIFATGYLQINETTTIGKLGSLVNDCRIAHIDHSTDNYAFQQSLLGITSINAVDGRYITFDISQNEKIRIDSSGNTHFNSSDPNYVAIDISATSGIKLPKGTTSERPEGNPDISGIIRYNTETQQFEGYATAWQGLGGVIDVNQDTKIMAEDYPTADNNELRFYTKNIERMKVDASGTIQMMIYDENYIALDISATTGIMLPKGNTAQRPIVGGRDTSIREDISGVIRYNTETQQFEGYATAWQGLGGVIDVDQNTKILAEDYPTADNNELKFFTAGTPRMIIKSDGKVDISENVHLDKRLDVSGATVLDSTLNVTGATVLDSTLNVTGDAVFGGQIHGPSTLYIDPSVVGDDTGLVIVKGNLQVDGTTTTINSTTVDVSDLTLKLAANSINTASSDGAGIEIQHGGSILYKDPDDVWEFNRGVSITSGTLAVTNSIDCGSSGTFTDTLTCSKDGTGLSVSKNATIGGTLTCSKSSDTGLSVTSNATIGGTLSVSNTLNCTGSGTGLDVSNNATIGGTLTVPTLSGSISLADNGILSNLTLNHNNIIYFENSQNTTDSYLKSDTADRWAIMLRFSLESCQLTPGNFLYFENSQNTTDSYLKSDTTGRWAIMHRFSLESCRLKHSNYLYFEINNNEDGAYIRSQSQWDQAQLYNFKLTSCTSDGDFVVDGDIDCDGDIECDGLTLPGGDVQTQIDSKQDTLTAGTNVTITGTTISSTDTIYSLPLAASGTRGGVRIGYSENGKNYPVELSSEKMYVNVPWTDTNTDTTYTAGTGLSLSGTQFSINPSPSGNGNKFLMASSTAGCEWQYAIKWSDATMDEPIPSPSGNGGKFLMASTTSGVEWNTPTTLDDLQIDSLGVGTTASGTSGEIRATNNITAYYSDERLKDFMGTIPDALEKINKLNGYYFKENELAKSLGYSNERLQIGVSAQEVEKILPEIVTEAPIDSKYKTVWYEKLVPLLIEAIKELTEKVKKLETEKN